MEYNYIQPKYINPKNITCNYTINYFKSIRTLGDKNMVKLSDIATEITDGTRVKRHYIDCGVKIINVGDFKDGTIYTNTINSISSDGLKEKDYIKDNDILITSVGKSGQVVRVTPHLEDYVISSDIIRIRLKQPSTAEGLVAYLRSESGHYALEAIKNGILNRISINDIKELDIPLDYKEMSLNKVGLSKESKEADKLYKDCVNLFEKYVVPEDNLFNIPNICFTEGYKVDSKRLDAKYYAYLESELYKITHRNCNDITWQPLGQIVKIKRAVRPNLDENKEIEYINISNVDADLSIITSTERDLYKNLSSRIRYLLEENELITAKSGSATGTESHSTAIITKRYEGMMASDAFYNIRPIEVDPYYLLFLFRQSIILKQIEAVTTGLYFKTINRKEFEEVYIPRLNPLVEREIAEKMKTYIEMLQK